MKSFITFSLLILLSLPGRVDACAACYGQSNDQLAQGMNWGIFSLLGVVGFVLAGFAAFGVYIVKRAATVAALSPELPEPVKNP